MLKQSQNLKDPLGDSHDDENTYEGAGHQENGSFNPPFFKKETNDACWKDSKTPNGKSRKQDQSHIPQGHHFFQNRSFIQAGQDMIGFSLQPSYGEKTPARMLQDGAIHRDLNIVISQGQRKVEEDRHLVEDGKKHRKRSPQGEVDEGEKEN